MTPTSACSWTATADVSWIVITSGSSGMTTGPITYFVPVNSGDLRRGTIAARTNGGAAVTLTIIQDGVARFALAGVVREVGLNGRAIVGAHVRILDGSGAFRITDGSGAFAFSGMPAGRLLFEITKDGYQVWETEIVLDRDMQLTITLSPTP
jgi:hypothetical protein